MKCERCLCEDIIVIHGHTQCTQCGSIVEEFCRGETESPQKDSTINPIKEV